MRPPVTRSTLRTCRTRFRPQSAATRSPRFCRVRHDTTSYCAISRNTAIRRKRSRIFACYHPPANAYLWHSSARSSEKDGGSEIYREGNQRYVAIKYSVRGRDLGGTVEEAMKKVNEQVKLPAGYHIDWEGEYESQKRADERLLIVLPITILLIFIILYTMFKSFKWALLILANVAMARIGGLLALLIHWHQFQCFLRRGLPGAVRRVRANRSHHAGIHQPASSTTISDRGRRRRRGGTCGCGRS